MKKEKSINLKCLNCDTYFSEKKIGEIKNSSRCPKCKSSTYVISKTMDDSLRGMKTNVK